jgi:predicted transcriptional regulator
MSDTTWNSLGPREKQLLAILRRADEPLASRDVLVALQEEGTTVAYTTVSSILDRLVEKRIVDRETETYAGSPRFLHTFDATKHRRAFVDSVVDDIARVLGAPGVALLANRAHELRLAHAQPTDHPPTTDT